MLWQKSMLSVKGKFKNGVAQPSEPIEGHDGQAVIITFLGENSDSLPIEDSEWNTLAQLLQDCAVETGIKDLAQEHDHYLYGKPKQE